MYFVALVIDAAVLMNAVVLLFVIRLLQVRDAILATLGWSHVLLQAEKTTRLANRDAFDTY